ncbi:MAG: MFS transporter [Oscillospiraceae bacterium]|nr:MFS transporter [Oscillospiraceae bacterium]
MKKETLWCRNYTLLMTATTLGAIGGIAGSYALSFLVFDETGSTLATGFLTAIQILPHFLLPVLVAPWMDRMPRKPFLVGGDLLGGLLYGLAGLYLHNFEFSYAGYLVFSLVINSVNAFDSLAYNCIFPKTIPAGFEDKGYTVGAMLYPVLNVLMMPLAALLMRTIGVANILFLQSGMSILAAITENGIKIEETARLEEKKSGFSLWLQDLQDGFRYLRGEKGLLNIYAYDAVTNGAYQGMSPIMVAFFSATPGFSAQLYSFFSAAEFIGRSIGGAVRYRTNMKPEKRRRFVYFVQQFVNVMDGVLLWLPYPVMLVNRSICGFLGINSATVRMSSIHQYLPEEYRARVNAFSNAAICVAGSAASMLFGLLGEILDYRLTMTIVACLSILACWLTVGRHKEELDKIYLYTTE